LLLSIVPVMWRANTDSQRHNDENSNDDEWYLESAEGQDSNNGW
jgi:hypothetical protein